MKNVKMERVDPLCICVGEEEETEIGKGTKRSARRLDGTRMNFATKGNEHNKEKSFSYAKKSWPRNPGVRRL